MTVRAMLEQRVVEQFGLTPRPAWRRLIHRAIVERARTERLTAGELERRLLAEPGRLDWLVDHVVVSETFFFRHPDQLDLVVSHVLARLAAAPTRRAVVWSAGCAHGEEPYSIGLALAAAAGPGVARSVSLLGTDLSASAVTQARTGRFAAWSWRLPRHHRPFVEFHADGSFTLAEWLRGWVEVDAGLVADRARTFPEEHVDVLLFRNVAIYLTAPALRETYAALQRVLRSDGLLFIAPTDPPPPDFVLLPGTTSVYRKASGVAFAPNAAPVGAGADAAREEAVLERPVPLGEASPPRPPQRGLAIATAIEHLSSGRYDDASAELRRATALDPEAPLLRYWHAFALTRSGLGRRAELQLNALAGLLAGRDPDALLEDQQTTVAELRAAAEQLRSAAT